MARATRLAVTMTASRSRTSASKIVAAWRLGTTRQWPELSGWMSMNVSVLASSSIFIEGNSPSMILQKTQSSTG
jgi:hypothetical protein